MRILLAEDDPTIVRTVRLVLAATPRTIIAAGNVADALAAIHAQPPDLVLTNLDLECVGDGVQLLDSLRHSDIPVVLFTAYALREVRHHLQRGAVAYLGKPCSCDELLALVARFTPAEHAQLGTSP